jgi:hypothetical protein
VLEFGKRYFSIIPPYAPERRERILVGEYQGALDLWYAISSLVCQSLEKSRLSPLLLLRLVLFFADKEKNMFSSRVSATMRSICLQYETVLVGKEFQGSGKSKKFTHVTQGEIQRESLTSRLE